MVKVKLLVPRVTLTESQNIGDVVEVSADEAQRMVAAGQCEPAKKIERAVRKEKAETR